MEVFENLINSTELCIWEEEKLVSFWGSCFSNFYPAKFTVGENEYLTSEQYFMFQKAMYFNDTEIAELIKNTEHPRDCKKLGRKVRGFDEAQWNKVKYNIMYDAVLAKFSQNEELKKALLYFRNKAYNFVEGSPYDKIWGVGIYYNDPLIADKKNWKGENLLGKCLDEVGDRLLKKEN